MPPFSVATTMQTKNSGAGIVTINVGGQLFQTTTQTLSLAGPKSILSTLYASPVPAFIDRDPDLFAVLLSLLRTGNIPSRAAAAVDPQDLADEAAYYGLGPHLVAALSNPSNFDAFNLEKAVLLPLNGRDYPTAVSVAAAGSVHVAHGSKITSFDPSLRRKSTVLTRFPAIDSLLALNPSVAAAGAVDSAGLQIIDLDHGVHRTIDWENQTRSISTVQAIGASPELLFVSFESGRRTSNSIVILDIASGFKPITEIAQQEIYAAEIDSALPATKLEWVAGHNLLLAAGSHSGPSGHLGNIRLWDIRSSTAAYELREKVDCFADVTVSTDLNALFKVGVNSGEVFMADLRQLGAEQPWTRLSGGEGRRVVNGKKEGAGCVIQSHGNQVFCSKGGEVELWSEVVMSSFVTREDGLGDRVFKKNNVGRRQDMDGGKINSLCFGGNKMVLSRKDQQCVEVWQSSRS